MNSNLITKADIAEWLQLPGTAGANLDDKRANRAIKEAQDLDIREALGYPLFNDLLNNYGSESIVITYTNLASGPFVQGNTVTASSGTKTATITSVDAPNSKITITVLTGDWTSGVTTLTSSGTTATAAAFVFGKYHYLMNGEAYTDASGFTVMFQGLIPALCYYAYARIFHTNNISLTPTGVKQKRNDNSDQVSYKAIAEEVSQLKSAGQSYLQDARKYLCDKNADGSNTYPLWAVTGIVKRKGGLRFTAVDRYNTENAVRNTSEERIVVVSGIGNTAWTMHPTIYTIASTYSYVSAVLIGKTIQQVQLGNEMLQSNQYELSGPTFTITDGAVPISSNMELRIAYT